MMVYFRHPVEVIRDSLCFGRNTLFLCGLRPTFVCAGPVCIPSLTLETWVGKSNVENTRLVESGHVMMAGDEDSITNEARLGCW